MSAGRIVGLDVARCLALLGMVAVHVLPEQSRLYEVSFGRASALFAVLAGVTVALLTGGRRPVEGAERAAATVGLAVRAVLIALLGLVLGELESGLAVILTYYGLLLLLALPFVPLGARALAVLAACWTVAAPIVSHLVRPDLPARTLAVPSFGSLEEPGQLLSELAFTGYYPVVPWLAYVLVGMAVGRMDLSRRAVQAALATAGLGLTAGATAASRVLADPDDVRAGEAGLHGVTPTGDRWEWLLVVTPHSATPFDLAQTIGTALAVIGGCLLLVGLAGGQLRRTVAVLFGAGTMTLTLYSLHVVLRTEPLWPPDHGTEAYREHVLVLLWVGGLFVALGRRGPFESAVRWAADAAATPIRSRRRP